METKRGKWIVFEGIDGAGKTTQIRLLADALGEQGIPVVLTAEPTDSSEGKLLRRILGGALSAFPEELAALFTADRIAHNREIGQWLADGKTVLCDRYDYSTLAYQGHATDFAWVAGLSLGCPAIRRPDLCVFLDLTPEESMARIEKNRATKEIFETRDQLTRVRDGFFRVFEFLRARPDCERIEILSAAGTPEEVAERIRRLL